MKLEILKCPSCGANIEFSEDMESCECEYCGVVIKNPNQPTNKILDNPIVPDVIKDISKLPIMKTKKKEPVYDSKGRIKRKGFSIISTFFSVSAALYLITGIAFYEETDTLIIMTSLILSNLMFALMFNILSHTPKKSEYIYGKEKGIKTKTMIVVLSLLAFASIMIISSTTTTEVSTDADSVVIEQTDLNV